MHKTLSSINYGLHILLSFTLGINYNECSTATIKFMWIVGKAALGERDAAKAALDEDC